MSLTGSGVLILLTILSLAPFADAGDRIRGEFFATRSEVFAQHGIAATSQPLATQIAIDILKQGGSAVDAAIAANAALGLMEPTGCGIGGDLFAIVWDAKTQQLHGLNASGRSPAALHYEDLVNKGHQKMPDFGPLPVTVPGCVDGWYELHGKFGKLPMPTLLAPAIRYAREGFPVSEVIAHYWSFGVRLARYPGFGKTFLPNGRAPRKGEIFRNPLLANTLEAIAEGGRDAFYRGALADRMEEFCKLHGCFLRKQDLMNHKSEWVVPLSVNYRGYDVWELPPNGQGIAALQMLNILEGFDLAAMGHNSPAYLHHLVEAKKLAFEDRARFYADPDFAEIPIDMLLSKDYAELRRKFLRPNRAAREYPHGDPAMRRTGRVMPRGADPDRATPPEVDRWIAQADARLRRGDTIYLTVADEAGNMVSLIQSNYRGFGSGLCPRGLGFCFQDRGALFTLEEGHPNVYAPNKRPFHTIIPAFVTKDGKPWLSFGVMGGDMQPQGHVQIICNLIDFGMNLQEAGDAPRFHHAGSSEPTGSTMKDGGTLALESGIGPQAQRDLAAMGHVVVQRTGPFGGYQAIQRDPQTGVYAAASESRKDGHAAGY